MAQSKRAKVNLIVPPNPAPAALQIKNGVDTLKVMHLSEDPVTQEIQQPDEEEEEEEEEEKEKDPDDDKEMQEEMQEENKDDDDQRIVNGKGLHTPEGMGQGYVRVRVRVWTFLPSTYPYPWRGYKGIQGQTLEDVNHPWYQYGNLYAWLDDLSDHSLLCKLGYFFYGPCLLSYSGKGILLKTALDYYLMLLNKLKAEIFTKNVHDHVWSSSGNHLK